MAEQPELPWPPVEFKKLGFILTGVGELITLPSEKFQGLLVEITRSHTAIICFVSTCSSSRPMEGWQGGCLSAPLASPGVDLLWLLPRKGGMCWGTEPGPRVQSRPRSGSASNSHTTLLLSPKARMESKTQERWPVSRMLVSR